MRLTFLHWFLGVYADSAEPCVCVRENAVVQCVYKRRRVVNQAGGGHFSCVSCLLVVIKECAHECSLL